MNLARLMWNIWKNNQNEDLQKIGPIICTVENEIPKYQTGYICKIASRWDLKSRDFSNLHFVGKILNIKKNRKFGTTQVINIKLVSQKSDKNDLCKYVKSDSQLLIFKITLDYILFIRTRQH